MRSERREEINAYDREAEIDLVLNELSASDKQVILLRYYRQLEHAQIAEALSTTLAAATKRVNRAVDRLRRIWIRREPATQTSMIATILPGLALQTAPAGLSAKLLATGGTLSVPSSKTLGIAHELLRSMWVAKMKVLAWIFAPFVFAGGLYCGLYSCGFILLAVALTVLGLVKRQRYAPYLFGAGVILTMLVVLSIYLAIHFPAFDPYKTFGINIYIVIIVAMVLLFAGGIGTIALGARILIDKFSRRRQRTTG